MASWGWGFTVPHKHIFAENPIQVNFKILGFTIDYNMYLISPLVFKN